MAVKNCAKALAFYENILGLELVQDNDEIELVLQKARITSKKASE